jgi:hypothetical protein
MASAVIPVSAAYNILGQDVDVALKNYFIDAFIQPNQLKDHTPLPIG